ncbi:MAG: hypothetical protein ABIU77_19120 [Ferruginibacter sp.]
MLTLVTAKQLAHIFKGIPKILPNAAPLIPLKDKTFSNFFRESKRESAAPPIIIANVIPVALASQKFAQLLMVATAKLSPAST